VPGSRPSGFVLRAGESIGTGANAPADGRIIA